MAARLTATGAYGPLPPPGLNSDLQSFFVLQVEKQPGRQELTQETFQTGRGMAPPSVLLSPPPSGGYIDAANSVFIPLAAMMRKVRNTVGGYYIAHFTDKYCSEDSKFLWTQMS